MPRVNPRAKVPTRPCERCAAPFPSAASQCTSCGAWHDPIAFGAPHAASLDQTILLSDVTEDEIERYVAGPWDYCFGGGIVKTSVNLIGGAPGAGKSTLALQIADELPAHVEKGEVLYVGAEETVKEIKARAKRLNLKRMDRIRLLPIGALSQLATIMTTMKPIAVFLDSLPGFVSDPEEGVELCTNLKGYAIDLNAPMIVVDHINKDEDFAGLMKLQHAVDGTFTLFPVETGASMRIFETVKNRNGPNARSSFFEMSETGLVHTANNCDVKEDEDDDE